MVLLEAMAARVPIVASRVGGIPEVLDFGRAGFLVEPGSVESLRGAIIRVAEQPRAIKEKVQEAANRVKKFYSSQAMAIRYLNVYQDILIKRNMYSGKNESRAV